MSFNIRNLAEETIQDIRQAIQDSQAESLAIQQYRNYKMLKLFKAEAAKSVMVKIAPDDMRALKASGYKLCFAKKVGEEDYSVVWQALNTKQYLANNNFSWIPEYQVFSTQTFKSGAIITQETDPVDIGLGQKITLDGDGIFGSLTDNKPDTTSITIKNDFGKIRFALSQVCTVGDRTIICPMYVGQQATMKGTETLQPKEKVLIWFEQNVETSTIYSKKVTETIEVDLSKKDSVEVTYADEEWSKTGGN